jgi:hypothetical protein
MGKLKKRKTRREKVLADLHRKLHSVNVTPTIIKEEKPNRSEVVIPRVHAIPSNYPYLVRDITRTGMVTGAIIVFQILLFLILKFQVLKLPGISY